MAGGSAAVGLSAVLLRAGAKRPHVLLAVAPGATAVRLAAERELRRRGWPTALAPADTDVLLAAGDAGGELGEALEAVWQAVPAPRARLQLACPEDAAAVLDTAQAVLSDLAWQRAALPLRARAGDDSPTAPVGHDESGHDEGGDGMDMPGGLPMADRGTDRDGLKLDQLHLPLGPFLPDWPAGLVVRVTLQGDVVQDAAAEVAGLPGDGASYWWRPWARASAGELVSTGEAARWRMAAYLDSLGRFLAVAGWDAAAAGARRLRDEALAGAPAGRLGPAAGRFARRVARSRALAWATRGLGVLGPDEALAAGVGGPALRAGGDVCARYRQWCTEVAQASAVLGDRSPADPPLLEGPRGPLDGAAQPSAALVAVLPGLLAGAEFAAARLIVASLDPDPDELAAQTAGAAHDG